MDIFTLDPWLTTITIVLIVYIIKFEWKMWRLRYNYKMINGNFHDTALALNAIADELGGGAIIKPKEKEVDNGSNK